jgi:GDPmannose 4,6-dehydratase
VLSVGNLAARRDWGFAPDYVDGMIRILRQLSFRAETAGHASEPDVGSSYRDYVLGTGELHAVWQLIDRAFALGGSPLEWDRTDPDPGRWSARFRDTGNPAIVVDPSLLRPSDPAAIGVDPSLARRELGWRPTVGLDHFLLDMLSADIDRPQDTDPDRGP